MMKSYSSRIRTNLNQRAKSRRRGGFTMAELLIVVAIMVVLFGFAFAGIINFVRNLNQTELDKTAEVIYVAAQNRMSEIYASGESYKLTATVSGQGGLAGIAIVQNAPADWDESVSGAYPDSNSKKLCMIASTSTEAANYLFPENAVIAEEWRQGYWIVEYDPDSLMVYSVFFSKKIEPASYYQDEAILRPVDAIEARRNYGGTVGYYGGPVAALNHEQVKTIYCQVKADEFNKEKLLAQIVVGNIPGVVAGSAYSNDIDLTITITGESSGKSITLLRTLTAADLDDSDTTDRTKRVCYLVLDGLGDGEHFKEQFGTNIGLPKKSVSGDMFAVKGTPDGALIPGENIMIEVQARCKNPYVNSPAPSEDTTNSLFASVDTSGGDVRAEVSYGRHLQNLDSAVSGFDAAAIGSIGSGKVNVFQVPNQEGVDAIDFSKNAPDNASPSVTDISPITEKIKYYYATYADREFLSVTNDNIESYDGQKNKIIGANVVPNNLTGNTSAGLFGTFAGSSLTDMHVINERVKGSNDAAAATGTLVGISKNGISVKGCMVYLNKDIDYKWVDNTYATSDDWIKGGKFVGGLIGESNGTVDIDSSMSSTVLKTSISASATPGNYVGGLIGKSNAAVTIKKTYTDSYLSGEQIAGMIANAGNTVDISASYVAGFALQQGATIDNAGKHIKSVAAFVNGSGITNVATSYTVFDFTDPNPDILKADRADITIYSIAQKEGTLDGNVFYTFGDDKDHPNAVGVTKEELRNAVSVAVSQVQNENLIKTGLGNAGFILSATGDDSRNVTYPYNLTKDFDLVTYPYPMLSIRHYGDWSILDIEPGTLVYWERYVLPDGSDPIYRFSGGGRSYLLSYDELKDKNRHVDLDGYAVLFPKDDKDDVTQAYLEDVTVYYNTYETDTLDPSDAHVLTLKADSNSNFTTKFMIAGAESEFQLRPIPYNFGNSLGIEQFELNSYDKYYLPITVANLSGRISKYYFNPLFASTVVDINDFEKDKISGVSRDYVSVRTPRQLYLMGNYYNHFDVATQNAVFSQELDLDFLTYSWGECGEFFQYQAQHPELNPSLSQYNYPPRSFMFPIGSDPYEDPYASKYFLATYDGHCRIITNVGLSTFNDYADSYLYVNKYGMFQMIARNATVKNVVYANNYSDSRYYMMSGSLDGYGMDHVTAEKVNISGDTFYNGMLAGINEGTITNCAVTGQIFYANISASANLHVGGLVGTNAGTITNSSADIPRITVNIKSSNANIGAFAGDNSGTINQCFANGHIKIPDGYNRGAESISGFVGNNESGRIYNSYCATTKDTELSLKSQCYGFTSPNGTTSGCYYINDDAYYYVDGLYAYNDFNSTAAKAISDPALKNASISGFGKMTGATQFNTNTLRRDAGAVIYPYPTSVRDANGNPVYYGEWPLLEGYGDFGFFYWEKEEGGTNSGYHYYLMTNKKVNGDPQIRSNLCGIHNDGGRITEYGYGFYAEKSKDEIIGEGNDNVKWVNIHTGERNNKAGEEIAKLFTNTEYVFHAYTTSSAFQNMESNHMYLDTVGDNRLTKGWGSVTIGIQNSTDEGLKPVTYYFSPYFAASMVMSDNNTDLSTSVGSNDYRFQVRNGDQLQYINWNNNSKNTKVTLNKSIFNNVDNGEASAEKTNDTAIAFPYLGYAYAEGAATKQHHSANYYWTQTHDIDLKMDPASNGTEFIQIGSIYDSNYKAGNDNSFVYTNYFNGDYNGNSYVIKNLQLKSDAMSVGMFGVTIGAHLDHLIVYSDQDNVIGNTDSDASYGWYNIGGLTGMALVGGNNIISKMPKVGIDSCVCSGYKIIDTRKNYGNGGANVGGLVGMSNVNISKSSSVNNITINPHYDVETHIRTGGIVGNFRGGSMAACYSGGSIDRVVVNNAGEGIVNSKVMVGFGGLIGGGKFRTSGNLTSLIGDVASVTQIEKSYTYVDPRGFRRIDGDTKNDIKPIYTSNNEDGAKFTLVGPKRSSIRKEDHLCYYYNPYGDNNYNLSGSQAVDGKKVESYSDLSGDVVYYSHGKDFATEDFYNRIDDLLSNTTHPDKAEYEPWYRVTIFQNPAGDKKYNKFGGKAVDGMFSFPGSDKTLKGKNYPFPTVIDQVDMYGDLVHVHYGAWPKANGIFTSAIEAELDMLSPQDQKFDVEITLYSESQGQIDIESADDITITSGAGVPQHVDYTKVLEPIGGKNGVKLTLTAKKTGSENLVITYSKGGKTYTENLSVRVTAEINVEATPIDLTADKEWGYVPYTEYGHDLSTGKYIHHDKAQYALKATDTRGGELTDGAWIIVSEDPYQYDSVVCEATIIAPAPPVNPGDPTEPYKLQIDTKSVGETTVYYKFVSNIKTGPEVDAPNATSAIKPIAVKVKDKAEYNIQDDERPDAANDGGNTPSTASMSPLNEVTDNNLPVLGDDNPPAIDGDNPPADGDNQPVVGGDNPPVVGGDNPSAGGDDPPAVGEDTQLTNEGNQ